MVAVTRQGRDPLLLPDRDEPYCLHDVHEKFVNTLRDEIVLDFGDSYLSFDVERNYDMIACQFQNKPFGLKRGFRRVGTDSPWARFLDKECGWTWLAVNQQGYWDTVLISFEAVVPNVMLNVMASSLYVFDISPIEKSIESKPSKTRLHRKNGR